MRVATPRVACAAVLAATACAAAATPSALAGSGGAAPPPTGGTAYVAPPKIKAVRCVSSCMSRGRVQSGGKLKLRGKKLAGVSKVVFQGAPGRSDDVSVRVRPASDRSVAVPVPMAAQSGRLEAFAGRMHSRTPRPVTIMPPAAPEPNAALSPSPGDPSIETSTSRSLLAIDQRGGVKFSYRVADEVAVTITLLRVDDGAVIRTWSPSPRPAGEVGTVSWDGLLSNGAAAPSARYAFRAAVASAGGATAHSASAGDVRRDAFDLRPALFPVMGKHNYGSSGARFGAGRAGHSHQGQDVMAACGLPLRAARGGVVKAKQYHAAAGNYIVIDGAATGVDMGYMHLRSPSPYSVGDRVRTGDQIGVVGETGDATACHLHFEEWDAPGWYSGGSPFDPLADLKSWDAYS